MAAYVCIYIFQVHNVGYARYRHKSPRFHLINFQVPIVLWCRKFVLLFYKSFIANMASW